MTITKRLSKGSALTHLELDSNFDHITSHISTITSSAGAASVGFLQSGGGAQTETVQTVLRQIVRSVVSYGATGNGSTDDTGAIQNAISAAITSGCRRVYFPKGTYKITSEIAVAADGVTLIFDDATLTTTSDITMLRVGASAASNSLYRGCCIHGRLTISGAGNAATSNKGFVVRNHEFGNFDAAIKITSCGGGAFLASTYARGFNYNKFGVMEITGNFNGDYFVLDSGAEVGGFINDNTFTTVRCYENEEGNLTHATFRGQLNDANRFYGFSVESATTTDTLLKITVGANNDFFGIRLDGNGSNTILDIAASQTGNRFWGLTPDGVIADASDSSLIISRSSGQPFFRFGDASGTAADGWDIGIQTPGSAKELHIRYLNASDGVVRFPNNTEVFFGNRASADNAPIEIIGEDKRINVRTLPDTAIGSGPRVKFEGEFSSSGNEGNVELYQDANGVRFEFSTASDMLHSTQAISVGDGITAPAAVSGRAIIYVDQADGDLKVRFGDGTIKTLATDT